MGRLMTLPLPLARLRDDMDRLIQQTFGTPSMLAGGYEIEPAGYPAVNVWEKVDTTYVEAELPGVSMEQVEVLVTGNELTIRGDRSAGEPQGATIHRRECPRGPFARTVALPWEISADAVEAKLADGVLTVALPKAEQAKARKVAVSTG